MSNYLKENLIAIPKKEVTPGDLAVKIGDEIFICGKPMQFYKCASVDSANETWAGYRAVLKDGSYSFETELTEGLFCDEGYTPAVGTIYSADAKIVVKGLWQNIITEGLVFRASFTESLTAETGQEFVIDDSVTAVMAERSGRFYAKFSYSASSDKGVRVIDDKFKSQSRTLCFWAIPSVNNRVHISLSSNEGADDYPLVSFRRPGTIRYVSILGDENNVVEVQGSVLYHFAVVCTDDKTTLYMDGVSVLEGSAYTTRSSNLVLAKGFGSTIYYRDFRFYDRALNADEIALVRKEGE